jgi:FkbM family methyltransferase
MTVEMVRVNIRGLDWWVRPGTSDEAVIKECAGYASRVTFTLGDVWLDGGGNVGGFSGLFHPMVDRIVCVEPEPGNLEVLHANLELHGAKNVTVVPAAIVGDDRPSVTLYLNQQTNKGSHSEHVRRGRVPMEVAAINIDALMQRHRFNKMKLDVEGAEVGILRGMGTLSHIKEMVMEYHFAALKDRDQTMYAEVLNILQGSGLEVAGPAPMEKPKNWHTLVSARRPHA